MEYVLSFERAAERRGMKKGIAKGIEKGETEKAKKTALRMLADGFELDMITKYTDLPVEEIKKLSPIHC